MTPEQFRDLGVVGILGIIAIIVARQIIPWLIRKFDQNQEFLQGFASQSLKAMEKTNESLGKHTESIERMRAGNAEGFDALAEALRSTNDSLRMSHEAWTEMMDRMMDEKDKERSRR